jgi:hypothetical protein
MSPHTTPLQNPPTKQALYHLSPPHVHSPKSPPRTTPRLQNPPNDPKKLVAIVDETNKDAKSIVDKFYDGFKNDKTKKLLEGLTIEGMTVEEFGNMATTILCILSMESRLFQNMSI